MHIPDVSGKIIKELSLEHFTDSFGITFADGVKIRIWDDGFMSSEERYIKCDDDLNSFVGTTVLSIEERDGPDIPPTGNQDCHETKFVHIVTNGGTIVLNCHNEHNGCYSGFSMRCRFMTKDH